MYSYCSGDQDAQFKYPLKVLTPIEAEISLEAMLIAILEEKL